MAEEIAGQAVAQAEQYVALSARCAEQQAAIEALLAENARLKAELGQRGPVASVTAADLQQPGGVA